MSHRSAAVEINGVEYASIKLAAVILGLDQDTVRRRVNSTIETWSGWIRKGKDKVASPSRACRKVRIKGQEYASVQAAATALGLTHNTVYARINSTSATYADYQFVTEHPTRISHRTRNVGVRVNGETHRNLGAAASAQGITRHGLRQRMRQGGQVQYYHTITGEVIA